MRITNKIMQRNSLSNINDNKILQDNLTTQMSTQKKISRPSDDPVVAIRALRLRSNVTEVSQYYSKNIPDAKSWMEITEDALKKTSDVITNMISQATKGANGDLTSSDRQIIMEQLKALGDEVYATGDASYAGRYVFTGYRTDTSLSFQKEQKDTTYTITEQLTSAAIDKVTHVESGTITSWTEADAFHPISSLNWNENSVSTVEVSRIRLSYDNLDNVAAGDPIIEYRNSLGVKLSMATDFVVDSTAKIGAANQDPYLYVSKNPNAVVLVKDTGELLLGSNRAADLSRVKDNTTTEEDESEIRVTYQKTEFASTDLRPEHFFSCTTQSWKMDALGNYETDAAGNKIKDGNSITYNEEYLDGKKDKQPIEYDVGFNQTIRVNSTADESYNLDIGREIDDLVRNLEEVEEYEELVNKIQNKIKSTTNESELEQLNTQLDAANKALTYAKDNCQKGFEQAITAFQGYLDDNSLAITNVGTRSSKLELIESRMQNQKTTFETLKSENEDIDITEVAIQLTSAELTYEAALTATGKIMQNTLLNYV